MHAQALQQAAQRLPCRSSVSRSSTRRPAAASGGGGGAPLITLSRMPGAAAAEATVVERRAADVAVVGSSTTALLAAYSLAKSGRKVLLLPDYGLSAASPASSPLQPLKLTDADPLLVHLASEASAYWRGLELLAGAQLLSQQQSLDVVLQPDADHAGAVGFSKLQEACDAAGVPASQLSAAEATALCPQLRLPPSAACLLQPDGGAIRAGDAAAAVRQLAAGKGVMLRDGLQLRGWRDRGSCFQLRASSRLAPDLVSLYEAEALLLAPPHWHNACLGLFGLQLEGLTAVEQLRCQLPSGDALQRLPLLQTWGAAAPPDGLEQPPAGCLMPLLASGGSRLLLQQLPAWGQPVLQPLTWQPAAELFAQHQQQLAAAAANGTAAPQPLQHDAGGWLQLQLQQLHQSVYPLVRDAGPPGSAVCTSGVRGCVPDGRPLVGAHPGFEQGRIVVAVGASGSERFGPGSAASSYQLSPLLAKCAADVLRAGGGAGAAGGESLLRGLALTREGAAKAVAAGDDGVGGVDSWEGLGALQRPAAVGAEAAERAADEAADARQDMMNAAA